MTDTEFEVHTTQSGLKYAISSDSYSKLNVLSNFINSSILSTFEIHMTASGYFGTINSFIATLILIFCGHTNIIAILSINILVSILSEIIWYHTSVYKIKGLSFVYTILGQTIIRLYIHDIILLCLAFFLCHNWLIALTILADPVATFISSVCISPYHKTYKQNSNIAAHVISTYTK